MLVAGNIPLQRLNKRQVRAYIQENNCSIDLSLNSQIPHNLLFVFDTIYKCDNDKVLAVSKDNIGNLYGCVNDWQTELNGLIELNNLAPVHILYNQVPRRDQFIQEVPYLISRLAQELKINLTELDRTLDSLLIIDQAIQSKNRQDYNSNKKLLGLLISYIGEVIKSAINGEWLIKQDNEPEWEPVIIASTGRITSFCILVFDELHEAEKISFYDLVSMLIESHKQ
jgi:hypothetical protein